MEKETRIISFYTQKGGSGKTTLTHMVSLALANKKSGKNVLVLDADTQQSLVKALEDIRLNRGEKGLNPPYDLEYCPLTNIQDVLKEKWGKYDYIIIDLPGTMDMEGVRTALLACDVVFLPIQPSQLDVTSAKDTIVKLQDIKDYKKAHGGNMNFYCLINQAEPKKISTRYLIEYIAATGVPYFENAMVRYEKFKYLLNDYENILELKKWGNEEHAFSKFFDEIQLKLSEN
jgi:chromosome partitioning protein